MGKFRSVLPAVLEWIELTLEKNRSNAVSVAGLGFPRLPGIFPLDLLVRAKVVVMKGEVPFPPLGRMGLPEFKYLEDMELAGITYRDTFFLCQPCQSEGLYFHELVHVVQWENLGVDFLLAYGAGLMQCGYLDSPLEKMAYSLQADFDRGILPADVMQFISRGTESIWNGLAPLISKAG